MKTQIIIDLDINNNIEVKRLLTFENPILGVGAWCNPTSWHLKAVTNIIILIILLKLNVIRLKAT